MRALIFAILAFVGIGLSQPASAAAVHIDGSVIADVVKENPLVEQIRLYCYDRYSGRFLHWGPCGGYYRPRYYRPRYYRPRYYYRPYRRYYRYRYY